MLQQEVTQLISASSGLSIYVVLLDGKAAEKSGEHMGSQRTVNIPTTVGPSDDQIPLHSL